MGSGSGQPVMGLNALQRWEKRFIVKNYPRRGTPLRPISYRFAFQVYLIPLRIYPRSPHSLTPNQDLRIDHLRKPPPGRIGGKPVMGSGVGGTPATRSK